MPFFALTIFLGAFLLFQVQPLMAKYILPWFGGGPGIWTTCMLFFQVVLVGGYGYAHWLSGKTRPQLQAWVHFCLTLAALAFLPIIPSDHWKPSGNAHPTLRILELLGVKIGLPYFVLSATGPLLQNWFGYCFTRSPYRLYALSNAGSLLALITYPVVVEQFLTRGTQAAIWGAGLAAYGLSCFACLLWLRRPRPVNLETLASRSEPAMNPPPGLNPQALWLILPACASVLLLAVTNKLCQDVAVIPFLWIVPLSLYLLSFIITFDNPRWYQRTPFSLLVVAALAAICLALLNGSDWPVRKQVIVYCTALWIACMFCHGELYRLRPAANHLTRFYLMIACGGALGGLFVSVLAPLIFKDYNELHWGVWICAALLLLIIARRPSRDQSRHLWRLAWLLPAAACFMLLLFWLPQLSIQPSHRSLLRIILWAVAATLTLAGLLLKRPLKIQVPHLVAILCLAAGTGYLGIFLWKIGSNSGPDVVYRARNFYGVLTLYEHQKEEPLTHHFLLQHGRITHGLQFADSSQSRWPTTYYGHDSGVGLAIDALPQTARRIGLVGLGAGTLACYGRAGDYLRIYEINPQVVGLANSRFNYLKDSPARVEIAQGDARLSMEHEPAQRFDLLVLDAFSGDAIPAHLLTREAFALYEKHMNPQGVLAVHISNHYLDLQPVVMNLAKAFDYRAALVDYEENDEEWWLYGSTWMLLSHNDGLLESPAISAAASIIKPAAKKVPLWTDDFVSLAQILK
jgi:spermidine synthase